MKTKQHTKTRVCVCMGLYEKHAKISKNKCVCRATLRQIKALKTNVCIWGYSKHLKLKNKCKVVAQFKNEIK